MGSTRGGKKWHVYDDAMEGLLTSGHKLEPTRLALFLFTPVASLVLITPIASGCISSLPDSASFQRFLFLRLPRFSEGGAVVCGLREGCALWMK